MPQAEVQTLAMVIDRWPFRDSDWVVLLLTPRVGMVTALARGARGSRRRFAGSLELLVLSRVRLRPPRGGGMHQVLEAEIVQGFPGFWEDLVRLETGQGLLLLSRDLLREAPVTEEVFERVREAVGRLEVAPRESAHGVLWQAALDLLACLGHPPHQDRCPHCGKTATEWEAAALGPDGVLRCGDCAGGTDRRFSARALDPGSGRWPGDRRETERLLSLWVSGILGRPWALPGH
ncbi:MAG TPA: recombination protein O N-terminal domain-containing protein [Myxococcota bacterium]|nr:recombination protein O N-terminal domain-containing protein [Myxococcota bacterium]HQK50135.1 recombination protein O N-terminal domain-containing protein [Myxococcota bacterium]